MLDTKGNPFSDISHASNLISDHIGSIKKEEKKKIHKLIEDSYEAFSITFNSSLIGDDAEATSIRLVRRVIKKVTNIIMSIKLHGKKLSGSQIASNVIAELQDYRINQFIG